ncbi:MarR family transcriptional regulator [Pseudonocardia eucalypti]|uniref:MarR family transcriptional regulator n=1 Tax=Pseudonocardia eucalypti TaxID=648755 RepID=A0ABP9RF68_9PSEU|nr:DNA-binding MarR family transcriptional regulator [Pseudonocardia eucalypti]
MDLPALTDDVGYLLSRTSGITARAANTALAGYGLRVRQYSVLSLAADAPDGLSQRELAGVLGLDPSQVVLLVDELADAGLVLRRPCPGDRRARLVVATDEGRRVLGGARRQAHDGVRHQLRALSDREQETLRDLLARVVRSAGGVSVGR